jgi:hypothetical protein
MDALALLYEAHAAGLKVAAEGDKLVVRGPKRAEAVARMVLANKAAIMAALAEAEFEDSTYWSHFLDHEVHALVAAGKSRDQAIGAAWWRTMLRWYVQQGRHVAPWSCAFCGEVFSPNDLAVLYPSGERVHLSRDGCLSGYGNRWRGEARAALVTIGMEPPQ